MDIKQIKLEGTVSDMILNLLDDIQGQTISRSDIEGMAVATAKNITNIVESK